jgi:signal transduction histidine kinase/CheY-like chemotaxis protein
LVKSGFHTKDFFRDLWTTVAAGRVWKGEIQNRAKDGTYYWVNTTIVPFLDEQGRPIQYLGIHFDITSRKEAERSLRNAKEVAEAAVSSQTEFVKTLSSEVREPMKRLMETLSLLQKENPLEKYHARLDEAVGSADFLLTLFNDVLDYSKILAGRLEFQNIHFNIRSTLDDVVFQCARQAELKNVELLVKSRAGVPLVLQGDPTRLREIIRTFLSMALSFARQGQIHVEVSVQESGSEQAMLRFMMTADTLVLSRDLKSRLEESFNHLDSSIMQVLSGSGIGPSLSKRLIHLLGGEMGIEALPEKGGTLFWFTVKLTVPTHLDSEDQWGRLVSKTGCKVLYCGEDDALFDFLRQQTCHFLGWADHCRKIEEVDERVVNACDESRPYDLVVFDFDLMQSQVLQLAHRLTTNPLTRSVKLVMLSSAAHRGDSDVARQAGFDGYLTKPISSRQLCDSLAMVMDISGDRQDALVTRHVCQELEEVNRKRALVIHHSEAEQARAIVILKSHGIAVDIASGIHEPGMLRGGLRYGLILLEYNPSSPFTVQDINRIRGHFLEGAPIPIIGLFEEKAHLDMLPEEARQLGLEGVIDWPPSEESFSLLIDKWFTS